MEYALTFFVCDAIILSFKIAYFAILLPSADKWFSVKYALISGLFATSLLVAYLIRNYTTSGIASDIVAGKSYKISSQQLPERIDVQLGTIEEDSNNQSFPAQNLTN